MIAERIPTPSFAGMSIAELIEDIEHAGFTTEGGSLAMFIPWQELKRRLAPPDRDT